MNKNKVNPTQNLYGSDLNVEYGFNRDLAATGS